MCVTGMLMCRKGCAKLALFFPFALFLPPLPPPLPPPPAPPHPTPPPPGSKGGQDAAVQTLEAANWTQVMLEASERGDTASVLDAIAHLPSNADINARDSERRTVLHYAAMHADIGVLEAVLQLAVAEDDPAVVDVNAVNSSGLTPCHCAACPCPVRVVGQGMEAIVSSRLHFETLSVVPCGPTRQRRQHGLCDIPCVRAHPTCHNPALTHRWSHLYL
jgi:hypothetical protein